MRASMKDVREGRTLGVLGSLPFTGLRLPVCQDTATKMSTTIFLSDVLTCVKLAMSH